MVSDWTQEVVIAKNWRKTGTQLNDLKYFLTVSSLCINPITLGMAKTLLSFGHSECIRTELVFSKRSPCWWWKNSLSLLTKEPLLVIEVNEKVTAGDCWWLKQDLSLLASEIQGSINVSATLLSIIRTAYLCNTILVFMILGKDFFRLIFSLYLLQTLIVGAPQNLYTDLLA